MNPDVSTNPQESKGKLNFKCSDVGPKNCDWQVTGNGEEEIMPKIEQHGREKHNLTIDNETRSKVRNAIQRKSPERATSCHFKQRPERLSAASPRIVC